MRIRRLDLALDLEAREQRHFVFVQLQLLLRLGRHEALHVLLATLVRGQVVAQCLADVIGQVIAQTAGDRVALLVDQERGRAVLGSGIDRCPVGGEIVEVPLEFLGRTPDTGGAHDRAHALRDIEAFHRLAGRIALLALDPARDAAGARVVRHQHQEPAGEADKGGECGAFVAALFLLDLNDQFLAFGQKVTDVQAATLRLAAEILLGNFLQWQKAVALCAVVNEGGLETGLDARYPAFVDVRFFLFFGRYLDRQVV